MGDWRFVIFYAYLWKPLKHDDDHIENRHKTVIMFRNCCGFQVLVQGWRVTQENLAVFLKNVQQQLEKLENTVAEVAGIAYDQIEAIRVRDLHITCILFVAVQEIKQRCGTYQELSARETVDYI